MLYFPLAPLRRGIFFGQAARCISSIELPAGTFQTKEGAAPKRGATPNGRAAGKDQRRYHRSLGSRWLLCQTSGPRPLKSYHVVPSNQ